MFGWLQALFLDAKARESLSRAGTPPRASAAGTKDPAPAVPPRAPGPARPAVAAAAERARLLREAAEIHRAKRKILDALSDEDRAKLVSMAILTFLNQGTEPPPDPKTRK